MSERHPLRLSLPDALLALALPGLGYFYSFAYEMGYLGRFGIPYWMIDLSVANIVFTVVVFVFMWLYLSAFLDGVRAGPWWAFAKFAWEVGWSTFIFLLVVSNVGIFIEIGVWPILVFSILSGLAVLQATFGLIAPLIRYKGPALERWKQAAERNSGPRKPDAHSAIVDTVTNVYPKAGLFMGYSVVFLMAIPGIVYGIGNLRARTQRVFTVTDGGGVSCLVLRKSGNQYLCSELAVKTHTLTGRIRLLNLDGETLEFYSREIGYVAAPSP